MRRPVPGVALAAGITVVALTAAPAAGMGQVKPRAGAYSGQEAVASTPMSVTFTVSKNRKRIVKFTAQAVAKAGCSDALQSVQAPFTAAIINGHFAASSSTYPQPGIHVTMTGTFTTAVRARGRIEIRFSRVKGCNASTTFVVKRDT